MPIYEYECKKCNHIFEQLRKITDPSKTAACPCCGLKSKRKISPAGFILKGKGFYSTDYKKNKTTEK